MFLRQVRIGQLIIQLVDLRIQSADLPCQGFHFPLERADLAVFLLNLRLQPAVFLPQGRRAFSGCGSCGPRCIQLGLQARYLSSGFLRRRPARLVLCRCGLIFLQGGLIGRLPGAIIGLGLSKGRRSPVILGLQLRKGLGPRIVFRLGLGQRLGSLVIFCLGLGQRLGSLAAGLGRCVKLRLALVDLGLSCFQLGSGVIDLLLPFLQLGSGRVDLGLSFFQLLTCRGSCLVVFRLSLAQFALRRCQLGFSVLQLGPGVIKLGFLIGKLRLPVGELGFGVLQLRFGGSQLFFS